MTSKLRERLSLAVLVAVGVPTYAFARALTLVLTWGRWHRWLPRFQSALGIRDRVLYLEVFHPQTSGYVHRVTNWTSVLERAGFETTARHALGKPVSDRLLGNGLTGIFFALYMLRRLAQCLAAPLYNVVVVRRELLLYNDYGNLFMERLLLGLNPAVVLDFDDDIAAAKGEPRDISAVGRVLRECPTKFGSCLRTYPRFIVGSAYLERLVAEYRGEPTAGRTLVIPTCVSYGHYPMKRYRSADGPLTLGWIGTNGNLPQLEKIIPELELVSQRTPLRLLVIAGRDVEHDSGLSIENRRWSLETEIGDLLDVDIGLMPLQDSRVERGKCGFKLIQYMGLGIVGVASAITTNCEIVTDGVDGFLVAPDESWAAALERVIDRHREFPQIGRAARATVEQRYSVAAHASGYVEFMRSCAAPSADL